MPSEQPEFFEEIFGPCPHGGMKPYCPQCVGDELDETYAKRREERETRSEENRLRATVTAQSLALEDASAEIRRLRWRLEAAGR